MLLEASAYLPAPQKVQTLCPSFGLTNPLVASQLEQLEDAIPLYLPLSQSVQKEEEAELYFPWLHKAQVASAAPEYRLRCVQGGVVE